VWDSGLRPHAETASAMGATTADMELSAERVNRDPLRAARSPLLSTRFARAFAGQRDPLKLMAMPAESFEGTHESTHVQSFAESHIQRSLEQSSLSQTQTEWGSLLEMTHMDGTQMNGSAHLLDTHYSAPGEERKYGSAQSEQEQSWAQLKRSVCLPNASEEQPHRGAGQNPAALPREDDRPYAVPKGGVRFDPSTGQVAEGFNVGEVPLPGAPMSDDECLRFGLPPGSKWVNNEAVKNPISRLFDPAFKKVDWNELPVVGAPTGGGGGGGGGGGAGTQCAVLILSCERVIQRGGVMPKFQAGRCESRDGAVTRNAGEPWLLSNPCPFGVSSTPAGTSSHSVPCSLTRTASHSVTRTPSHYTENWTPNLRARVRADCGLQAQVHLAFRHCLLRHCNGPLCTAVVLKVGLLRTRTSTIWRVPIGRYWTG
jgi:hypothetical protein